jgi:predicted RNase H-like HicB family nuclease
MMKLLVVYENAGPNYSAYVPDLPGCVSTGGTKEEVACNIREAIALHLAGMLEDGERFPEPIESWAEVVEVSERDVARARTAFVT